jgi:CheY-like chemotaxis protein
MEKVRMAEIVALHTSQQTLSILLVEDSKSDALLIEKWIDKAMPGCCRTTHVGNLSQALIALGEAQYDIALLDLSLPDGHEFDVNPPRRPTACTRAARMR